MIDTDSKLITEFLKDHQQFSRLLYEIEKLLNKGEISKARVRAKELDQLAGPHIQFEETELYPRLARLGENKVTEELLVDQHLEALEALRLLVELDSFSPEQLDRTLAGFQSALEHAEHCGSLISLMAQLDEDQQQESLEKLEEFRRQGKRWTETED